MAKILIFSDSHGSTLNIRPALELHAANSDYIVHLGDGAEEFLRLADEYPGKPFLAVRGNCDEAVAPPLRTLEVEEKKILLCHGHSFGVKGGIDTLALSARRSGVDIALYGHTHTPLNVYLPEEDGFPPLYVFCPGSISLPAEGYPSYGLLEISPAGIMLSHGEISGRKRK